jgi:hypothetical protein
VADAARFVDDEVDAVVAIDFVVGGQTGGEGVQVPSTCTQWRRWMGQPGG